LNNQQIFIIIIIDFKKLDSNHSDKKYIKFIKIIIDL